MWQKVATKFTNLVYHIFSKLSREKQN
jgi:hypothetical protein